MRHDHSAILGKIAAYQAEHNLSDTAFGRLAVNDGKLIPRLRDGVSITMNTVSRVNAALAEPHVGKATSAAATQASAA